MARGVRVRIKSAGARSVLTSSAVQGDLDARAERIADRANAAVGPKWEGTDETPYKADSGGGKSRARAVVFTRNVQGMYDNNKRNTLLKSLDAGRG